MAKIQGKVKFFDSRAGFGFIERDGEKDVFLGQRTLKSCGIDSVKEGDALLFDLKEEKGRNPSAVNISRA